MPDPGTRTLRPGRPFHYRLLRLYGRFRGNVGLTLYAAPGYGRTRRRSAKLAWKYARKGGGANV